jgi:RNA polymerase sigma-70 factor, ECF subfamily
MNGSPALRTRPLTRAGRPIGLVGRHAGHSPPAAAAHWPRAELSGRRRESRRPSSGSDLLARMQDGDIAAFRELYDRYCDRAYRVARGLSIDDARAEEVVREAFAMIWRSRSICRPDRTAAAAWVLTAVHDRAIDVARRDGTDHADRASGERLDDEPALHEIDDEPATDESSGGAVRRASPIEVRRVLGRLPTAQREVLVLALYGELSQTEIAGELDVPVGTIKTRMRRGLTALRQEFQESAA